MIAGIGAAVGFLSFLACVAALLGVWIDTPWPVTATLLVLIIILKIVWEQDKRGEAKRLQKLHDLNLLDAHQQRPPGYMDPWDSLD